MVAGAAKEALVGRFATGQDYWTTPGSEELGLRSMRMADGPHGLRVQNDQDPDHLGLARSQPATCFPPAVTLASSWDIDLVEEVGRALGAEARAQGVDVLLGPGLNIKRTPLCGRNFEYFSEDPLLAGLLAAAAVRGIQSRGVAATLKHFAANNQETERMAISADIDARALHEIYLRAFSIAIREGAPWAIMSAYNAINGAPASANHFLLHEVLRDAWGFDGVVVSDWGAIFDPVASLAAGVDLRMPGQPEDGRIDVAIANGALDRTHIERVVERLKLLAARTMPSELPANPDIDAHHHLVRRAAAESAVLLKNENDVLPLSSDELTNAVVIGELAREPRYQGAGSSAVNPHQVVTAWEALSSRHGVSVFEPGYRLDGRQDADLVERAVSAASQAQLVLVFAGLPPEDEVEGKDRETIGLPAAQVNLIQALASVEAPVVVVLSNGSAVTTAEWRNGADAVLECWLTGQAHGDAIVDVLSGKVNPAGRLAETIPLRLEDTPAFLNFPGEAGHVRYGEGIHVGYRWYDARSLQVDFPFGYGLSYTSFRYADLSVAINEEDNDIALVASLTLTNVGNHDGAEVVQLYIGTFDDALQMPKRELRAFTKLWLQAGESRRVTLAVKRDDLAHYHPQEGWYVAGGPLTVAIGASSRDLRLFADVSLPGPPLVKRLTLWSPLGAWLDDPAVGPTLRSLIAERGGMRGRVADLLSDPAGADSVLSAPMMAIVQFPGVPLQDTDCLALLEGA